MQPTLSKIILTFVVLIILCVGIAAWFFSHSASPSAQTNYQTSYGSTVTEVAVNTTQSQTQTPVNMKQAYTNLFQNLSAQAVVFTTASATSTGDTEKIYALYASDIAVSKNLNPSVANFSLPVAFVDLNNDGVLEAFVYENLLGFCGSAGCPLALYAQKSGTWTNVLSVLGGEDVGISKNSTDRYKDLFLSVAGETDSQTNIVRYSWDGTQYQPGKTVATWDGTTFNIVP